VGCGDVSTEVGVMLRTFDWVLLSYLTVVGGEVGCEVGVGL
jgi:hypothetical protein